MVPVIHRPQSPPKPLKKNIVGNQQPHFHRPPIVQRKNPTAPSPPKVRSATSVSQRVIQPYTEEQIVALGKIGKVSTNKRYILVYDDVLYVKNGIPAPHNFIADTDVMIEEFKHDGAKYRAYKHDGLFMKDCLHTAEELINQKKLDYGKGTYSRVRGLGLVFGREDDINAQYAQRVKDKKLPHDEKANPDVGQAYAIVETGSVDKYPYHAAAVVAKDGNDTVTIEVSAGSKDAKDYNTPGELHMYEIGGGGKSFHSDCKAIYDKPITIVIVPK